MSDEEVNALDKYGLSSLFITARVRSTREGTVFIGVCPFTSVGGGVPTFPVPRWGGGCLPSQFPGGGEGYLPSQFPGGGVPTLDGGGGTYLGWGDGVSTLDGGGTYLGWGRGTYLE